MKPSPQAAAMAGALAIALGGCDEPPTSDEIEPIGATDGGSEPSGTAASDEDEPADPISLVSVEAWTIADAPHDPLAHERPDSVDCPSAAWGPEWGRLEIQTGACSYFFATQPGLASIEVGDAIEIVVFHDRLDAAEPSEGHVALLLDDEVIWEHTVEIPTDAAVLEGRVVVERSWPDGASVGLHLHNHGFNAWTIADVTVVPGGGR